MMWKNWTNREVGTFHKRYVKVANQGRSRKTGYWSDGHMWSLKAEYPRYAANRMMGFKLDRLAPGIIGRGR